MIILILGFIIFVYSIILHEIAHGLVAERLGDPTARVHKRLTLNPIPHIDLLMSIVFPLFLILSGSPIVFGSAKPVPIDPYNLKDPKKGMGMIGAAGPITNVFIAVILSLIARIIFQFDAGSIFITVLARGAQLNIMLALFNLIPIPPLDGGRVAVALLPNKYSEALASIENFGIFIIVFLLLFPNRIFSLQGIIFNATSFIFNLIFAGLTPV